MLIKWTTCLPHTDILKKSVEYFFYWFLFSALPLQLHAQCEIIGSQLIPDNEVLVFDFNVSGLIDNDLASPTQGICGVEIDFMHEYLGDLTIALISPSGIRIELIGPVTSATAGTNLSRWNISFVPCMTAAIPDVGFTDVWSNLQAWQSFTAYSGSYHPTSGCLEDFNSGPANGAWQVLIEDHDIFQTGSVEQVRIIFCNPTGLQCIECKPDAGILSPLAVNLCTGESIHTSDFSVDYLEAPPSPFLYNYQFMLLSGNTVIRSGSSFSDTPAPGNYTMCGLSYHASQSSEVNALLAAGDRNQLVQAINSGTICADISASCILITVLSLPDTIIVNENLCYGETFSFGGQTYINAGTYYQVRDGQGACDSIFEINITKSNLVITIDPPQTLHCGNGDVVITAVVTGNSGNVSYEWSTHIGNITGPSNGPAISVNQAGQYVLSVTDSQCSTIDAVVVIADAGFPQVFVQGGVLNCYNLTLDLSPIYIPSDGTVLWTGPLGFSSNQSNISVSTPGTYFLNVSNAFGCSTIHEIEIEIDTVTHTPNIIPLEKNCAEGYVTLANTLDHNVLTWDWYGPSGYLTNYWRPNIAAAGLYTLTLTFRNGCKRSASYFFNGDFSLPNISGPMDDTVNCNEVIPLTLSSTTPGVTYGWSGPKNFSSTLSTITIQEPGSYVGTVYSLNGCKDQITVEIVPGDDIFDFDLFFDTINCKTSEVDIGAITTEADLFEWINYSGPDSLESTISVSTPGVYTLMMTDTSTACVLVTTIMVPSDFTSPSFGYSADTITCADPVSELSFIPFQEFSYAEVFWRLPDQSIVPGPNLSSSLKGEHQLVAIGANGCIGTWRIHIPFDTLPPVFFLESDSIDCLRNRIMHTVSFDSLAGISWTGPAGFTSNEFNPMILDTGLYMATGIGANGCSVTIPLNVNGNFDPPPISLALDTISCLPPFAEIVVNTSDSVLSYEWLDEQGIIIGTDSSVRVNKSGTYTLKLEGKNHCISVDSITLDPGVFPSIIVHLDTFTCQLKSLTLIAESDIPDPDFWWMNMKGDTLNHSDVLDIYNPGPFIISVSGQNSCEVRDTILVPTDTIAPEANITLHGEIRCQNLDFMLEGSSPSPLVLFQWNVIGGQILSDSSQSVIDARDTGLYILTVTDLNNGCLGKDSLLASEHPDAINSVILEISPPCRGDSSGFIKVISLSGGVQPVYYQLDGGILQLGGSFDMLTSGPYLLQVLDAQGCLFDTLITLVASTPFTVDAGPDQQILLGESLVISGETDLAPGQVMFQAWESMGQVICQDCSQTTVAPLTTTSYQFLVTSESGCVETDEMTVFVDQSVKYYISNVFTPNGDNVNDEIRIYPSQAVARILRWSIFDRWGNSVFSKSDFNPLDASVFWNGLSSGSEPYNPGVFTYIVEVELKNGTREFRHGTITLLR